MKVANIGQQGQRVLLFICVWLGKSSFGQLSNDGLSVHVFGFGPTLQT